MATKKASIKKVSRPKTSKFSFKKIPDTKSKVQVAKAVKLQKFHAAKIMRSSGSSSKSDSSGRSGSKIPSTAGISESIKPTIPGNY